MNEESISDANHDEAAKAFRQAGNNVQLLVRYNPAEFNRFQVNTHSLTPNVNQVYLFSFPVSVFVCMYIRILYIFLCTIDTCIHVYIDKHYFVWLLFYASPLNLHSTSLFSILSFCPRRG